LEPDELYLSLGLAIAAGLLIGIERELSAPRASADGSFLGGARTHPLGGAGGRLSVLLSRETGWPVVVAAFPPSSSGKVTRAKGVARRGPSATTRLWDRHGAP